MLIFFAGNDPDVKQKRNGGAVRFFFQNGFGQAIRAIIDHMYRPVADIAVGQYIVAGKFGDADNGVAAVNVFLQVAKMPGFPAVGLVLVEEIEVVNRKQYFNLFVSAGLIVRTLVRRMPQLILADRRHKELL